VPSMPDNSFAYLAPLVSSDTEVWAHRKSLCEIIKQMVGDYAEIGLKRGMHYSLKPLSQADLTDIIEAESHFYPSKVPLIEIRFLSSKYMELAMSAGIVRSAIGDATEGPIWG
jgi:hypothetical protein